MSFYAYKGTIIKTFRKYFMKHLFK